MRWLFWWLPPCLLRAVIVNLTNDPDTAIRGVLWTSRGPWLVLRDASLLRADSNPIAIDGEAIVHRNNVAFLQVIP